MSRKVYPPYSPIKSILKFSKSILKLYNLGIFHAFILDWALYFSRCYIGLGPCIFQALIIGSGPCGLRLAVEMALLGARVVIVEMRDYIERNNVLKLWPFVIHDLKALGAKIFYPKFCTGALDHISKCIQVLIIIQL